ncbi:hypothetical protein [Bifidobacterium callimiconis]|uniref:Uncharacterized protein n=1 Tax=Bifidobacterium callimiconis TaxID=2306973 RepID=A0A430FGP3_9BIFI|nr:hypothetical protein [Bifidobacterium callimiconis]RSX52016.1 hypothetical protein D2E23_0623 [Bifidobacterium callimiconis]
MKNRINRFTVLNIILVVAIVATLGVAFAATKHVGPFAGRETTQTTTAKTGADSQTGKTDAKADAVKNGNEATDGSAGTVTAGASADTGKTAEPAPSPSVTATPADVRQHASDLSYRMNDFIDYRPFEDSDLNVYDWISNQRRQRDISAWTNSDNALGDWIKAGIHFDDSKSAEESAAAIRDMDDAYATWEHETLKLLNQAMDEQASQMAQSATSLQQSHPGYCSELVGIVKERPATGETRATFEAQKNWHDRLSNQWMQCEARAADPTK